MLFNYLGIGFLASIIGALPLGATNIAVINTTLKENSKQALKIAITAGVAEVLLAYFSLHYNMYVEDFFNTNQWIEIVMAFLFLSIGCILFIKKPKVKTYPTTPRGLKNSKYVTGLLLGLLNPPVLIYWLLVISFINANFSASDINTSTLTLFLFFTGVYFGKLITLHIYSKFSMLVKHKFQNTNLVLGKFIGSLLFAIGIFQFFKLYFL